MGGNAIDVATIRQQIGVTEIEVSYKQAQIKVFVARSILYTSELPGFPPLLLRALPALGSTLCHNDNGLAFTEEVFATEMGHVLEHVVLALLMEQGIYAKGVTEWNWFAEPEGTFTITLTGEGLDLTTLSTLVDQARYLLAGLLQEDREAADEPQEDYFVTSSRAC